MDLTSGLLQKVTKFTLELADKPRDVPYCKLLSSVPVCPHIMHGMVYSGSSKLDQIPGSHGEEYGNHRLVKCSAV
jgi:hypothetical protein